MNSDSVSLRPHPARPWVHANVWPRDTLCAQRLDMRIDLNVYEDNGTEMLFTYDPNPTRPFDEPNAWQVQRPCHTFRLPTA